MFRGATRLFLFKNIRVLAKHFNIVLFWEFENGARGIRLFRTGLLPWLLANLCLAPGTEEKSPHNFRNKYASFQQIEEVNRNNMINRVSHDLFLSLARTSVLSLFVIKCLGILLTFGHGCVDVSLINSVINEFAGVKAFLWATKYWFFWINESFMFTSR